MYELSLSKCSQAELKDPVVWIDPRFLEAVAELHQLEARLLLCYKGEKLAAAMPIYERKKLGFRVTVCPMSAYYHGLWFFWEEGREENRNLLDELKIAGSVAQFLKSHYKRFQVNLAPHNLDVRGFTWQGLKALPFYTFIHDLSQPLQPFRVERRKLRSAQDKGYRLVEEFSPEIFSQMIQELYNRKEKNLGVDEAAFQAWMKKLHEIGLLSQLNLMDQREVVSTNLILGGENDHHAYAIMQSTQPDHLKAGASVVHTQLMAERLKDRFSALDFCGANYPEVARFKAAMGMKLKVFFRING